MWLTNLAIKRPVVIMMAFLALAVLGIKSKSGMRTDLYPKVDFPYITIITSYAGAGPEEIETLVSKPIEDAVGSVSGMKNLTSSSQEGVSIIGIELELGTNVDAAMSDVRAKVDAARRSLPQDVDIPVIQKADIGAIPVLTLGMSSNRPAKELRELADDVIKDRLGKLKGVASVSISGGDIREIQVNVDKSRLEAYGLSISQIAQGLVMGNLNLPSGRITEGRRDYAIRAVGEFSSPDEIRNLKLTFPGGPNGHDRVLRIGDIAEVKDTTAEREDLTRLQQKDSIGLQIIKQTDANTVEVVDGAKKELATMRSILPKDVRIAVVLDQSDRVRESLDDVNMSLILGALLAVLIVFLFLHNIRGTMIVGIAIPMSIIATFIPISFAGFTLNMMVMMGLSLAVGILVDDSIVVLENIYRHLAKGESPAEAALNGRTEIGLAAITITMVDMVVFLPIAFMSGIVGMFFREFGITVASATLFSLIVSFTLTPMLASRWYRKDEALEAKKGFFLKFDEFYHVLDRRYRGILAWALHHRWQVLAAGFGTLIVVNIVLGPMLGQDFFPRIDQGSVAASIEMPAGTSLAATNAVATKIEALAAKIPETTNVFTTVGSSGGGGFQVGTSGPNFGTVTVALMIKESMSDRFMRPFMHGTKRRVKPDELIAEELRAQVSSIPGADIKVKVQSGMGGGESPIDMEISGGTDAERNAVAEQVKRAAASAPGVQNADLSWKVGKPEIKATIDRVRAAEMGVSVGQIASALRTSIAGNTDTHFRQNGKEYDIRVRLNEYDRYSLSDVGRTVVGSSDGQPIYLQDVAKITQDAGPTKIERKNRQRKISVTGDVARGFDLRSVRMAIDKNLKGIGFVSTGPLDSSHDNVHLHWGGQVESMSESFGNMGGALLLSIALVYMLMAALFESLLNPLVIMFSIPMALVGAIIALVLTGENMSIVSMIGIIMLMGLVTKNAILLIDYTNTLRARGKERNEAILEAGPTRLRPILMTTFAMVFGMLPTALKLGRGSEMRAPMAIAVIGGLIVSTMLTLVIIPVTYTYVDDLQNKFISWKRRILGHKADDEMPQPESEF
jgi:hydrophobic/amphiphilic exporter-1 (mainly G- bacteria), HAE1 family